MAYENRFCAVSKRDRYLYSPSNITDIDSSNFSSLPIIKRQKLMKYDDSNIVRNVMRGSHDCTTVPAGAPPNGSSWMEGSNASSFSFQDRNAITIQSSLDSCNNGASRNAVHFPTAPLEKVVYVQQPFQLHHQNNQNNQHQYQHQQQQHSQYGTMLPSASSVGNTNINCECCFRPITVGLKFLAATYIQNNRFFQHNMHVNMYAFIYISKYV